MSKKHLIAGIVIGMALATPSVVLASNGPKYKVNQNVYVKDCGWDCTWWAGKVIDGPDDDGLYFVSYKAKNITKTNLKAESSIRNRTAGSCKL